jgi:hypothetical protein
LGSVAVAYAGTGYREAYEGGDHDSALEKTLLSKNSFNIQDAASHPLGNLRITFYRDLRMTLMCKVAQIFP